MISAPATAAVPGNTLGKSQRYRLLGLALLSCGIVLAFSLRTPITVYNDPTFQLKALEQYQAGTSPNFNTLVSANPGELSRSSATWIALGRPGWGCCCCPCCASG
ncbi:MAG TPA: hypothetical protein VEC95_04665 [Terriglobales bacterium]|nr:hypothetical protein [Terriglobales bacterium]